MLTTLVSFDDANGALPDAGLIADAAGNLYGTTHYGGARDGGTIFRLAVGTNAFATLASFDGRNGGSIDGSGPSAELLVDAAGNLYGTTLDGGAYGVGTIFRLAVGSDAPAALASFDGANGSRSSGPLLADAAGNLYGTGYGGGVNGSGNVFKLAAGTNALTTLASLGDGAGEYPHAGLIADAAGNFYGTTYGGGSPSDDGTVFKVAAGTHVLTTLATFDGANGQRPVAELLRDAAGNLYGTTISGGAFNVGTVFKIAAGTGALTTLVTFDGRNGVYPHGKLIADADGNLYGTTNGGLEGTGTIFRLAAGTHALTTLLAFDGANGTNPRAGLIADAAGNLYGTTNGGGAHDYGTVFKLAGGGFVVGPAVAAPEVRVGGNGVAVADGDGSPQPADLTDFGSTPVGVPVTRTFAVTNDGAAALTTGGLTVPSGFAIVEGLSATIAAGTSDTFTLRLTAAADGAFAGDVGFASNDADENPYTFAIRGVVSAPRPTAFASVVARRLALTGTAGGDRIGFAISGPDVVASLGSQSLTFARADFDRVEVQAGDGGDRVDLGDLDMPAYISGGTGDDTLVGGLNGDTLLGGGGSDRLLGRGGDDRVSGSGGRDFVYGEAGDDRVYGDDGNDRVDGGGNRDRLYGGAGDDVLVGGGSNDRLYGDAGRDTLYGNDANDLLEGGAEADTLFGGAGTDVRRGADAADLVDSVETTG